MVSKEKTRKDISPETLTEQQKNQPEDEQHLIYHTDMRFTTFADKQNPYHPASI